MSSRCFPAVVGWQALAPTAPSACGSWPRERYCAPSKSATNRLSPDGRHLATCHWDDVLRLWNLGKKQLDAEFKRHEVGVADVLFPHDGQTLFSASQNGIIRTWYVKHGRLCGVLFDPARKRCKRVLSSEYHCDSGSLGRWLSQRPADFVDAILRRVK